MSKKLSRRVFVKGAAVTAAAISAGGLLSACSSEEQAPAAEQKPAEDTAETEAPEPEAEEEPATETAGSSVLVAYFSATGNTEGIAQAIADELGADTFAITPTDPYTSEDLGYNNDNSRTSQERNDPNCNVELEQVTPDNFDVYDTVFLGYPIWWGDASWVMDNFVAGNDFTGKTVYPFCTSGSSSIGQSGQNLADMAGTGEWQEGRRFGAGAVDDASEWLGELGY